MTRHKGHHITDDEANAILAFCGNVLMTLGMGQWVILIMDEPCDEDAHASVEWVDGRYLAQVRLATDWMELREEQRRNAVTHEILHLVHSRVSDAVDEAMHVMPAHEFSPFKRRFQREVELMVDHFATFMADTHTLVEAWDVAHTPKTDEEGA